MSRAETHAAALAIVALHGGRYAHALKMVKARREAAAWNERYPVGTSVVVTPYTGCSEAEKSRTVTRSPAWAMSSGHASVMVEGKAGGYGLEWVKPTRGAAVPS